MSDLGSFVRRIVRAAARRTKLAAELDALKSMSESSPNHGIGALIEALNLCTDNDLPLPPWLARAIRNELHGRVSSETLKHYRRWREVRKMRDMRPLTPIKGKPDPGGRPPAREIGYDATFKLVADLLEKTPAKGSPKAIKRSYALVERDLPEALRYKRTYTKLTR